MLTTWPAEYRTMLAEDRHERPDAYAYATAQLFTGVPLDGRRALEIGSGTGLLTIYMALHGARVTSLEPEGIGATNGVIARQQARIARLRLRGVEIVPADFNVWETDQRFDVIVARNSINHLYASDRHARRDAATADGYIRALERMRRLLAPGGVVIATDASRYAFWTMNRAWLRRPWKSHRSGVNWRHHQTPQTWRHLCRQAGFSDVTIDYPVPYALRHLAPVANTAPANFFLKGAFILRASVTDRQ